MRNKFLGMLNYFLWLITIVFVLYVSNIIGWQESVIMVLTSFIICVVLYVLERK